MNPDHASKRDEDEAILAPIVGQAARHTIWRAEEELSGPRIKFLKKAAAIGERSK